MIRPITQVEIGQHFKIPDFHGGYAVCCRRPRPAVFEMIEYAQDLFGLGQKCVDCGTVVPDDHTLVQVVEIVE